MSADRSSVPVVRAPLPSPQEALGEPLRACPLWCLKVICDRCGKDQMVNEGHAPWWDRTLADILRRMRHDGCGGLPSSGRIGDRDRVCLQPPGAADHAARGQGRPN
jgi:hypothetical protein